MRTICNKMLIFRYYSFSLHIVKSVRLNVFLSQQIALFSFCKFAVMSNLPSILCLVTKGPGFASNGRGRGEGKRRGEGRGRGGEEKGRKGREEGKGGDIDRNENFLFQALKTSACFQFR